MILNVEQFGKIKMGVRKECVIFFLKPFSCLSAIFGIYLNPDTISVTFHCSKHRCACSTKWIKDGITKEGEHSDKSIGKFEWKRGWMIFSRCTIDIPELLKPLIVVFFFDSALVSLNISLSGLNVTRVPLFFDLPITASFETVLPCSYLW